MYKNLLHQIGWQERKRDRKDMSQFVRYSFSTGRLEQFRFGLVDAATAFLAMEEMTIVAIVIAVIQRSRRPGDGDIRIRLRVCEPFVVNLKRVEHPVLMEGDDKLRLEQFQRVVIRSGLEKNRKRGEMVKVTDRHRFNIK